MTAINSRADLESLRGTSRFDDALRMLHGSLVTWALVDGDWSAEEDLSAIERLGYSKEEFLAETAHLALPPPTPPLGGAPAPTLADYQRAVEAHIEDAARSRDYGSAVSAASYVSSTNPAWRAEAEAFVAWRDAVWLAVYAALGAWQAGGEAPTIEGLIADLPEIDWTGGAP